jgi:hypothetical protein
MSSHTEQVVLLLLSDSNLPTGGASSLSPLSFKIRHPADELPIYQASTSVPV